MFFGEASFNNILVIKSVLRCFELVSSLKVGFSKSSLGAIGVDRIVVERWANILNCRTMNILFNYIGLPIGVNPRMKATWRPLIDKIKKKLSNWKHNNLSFARGIYLINSVLSFVPFFYIYFFKMPNSVLRKVVAIQRNFL